MPRCLIWLEARSAKGLSASLFSIYLTIASPLTMDFSFTTERPEGSAVPLPPRTPGGGGPKLRRQLRVLKEFIESFHFTRMKPDYTTIKSHRIISPPGAAAPGTATVRALAEPGQAYAIYINGGARAELVLELPTATYKAEWISTETGQSKKSETFAHGGGNWAASSPDYSEDIALRVIALQ